MTTRDLPAEYAAHVARARACDVAPFTYAEWLETVVRTQEIAHARFLRELAAAFGLPAGTSAEDVLREVGTFVGDGR